MSAFSAAIRPTVGDVRRHPWRTIAAIVLIALPIAFLCHYSIRNSSHSSYFNALAMKNSATFVGGTCEQSSCRPSAARRNGTSYNTTST